MTELPPLVAQAADLHYFRAQASGQTDRQARQAAYLIAYQAGMKDGVGGLVDAQIDAEIARLDEAYSAGVDPGAIEDFLRQEET